MVLLLCKVTKHLICLLCYNWLVACLVAHMWFQVWSKYSGWIYAVTHLTKLDILLKREIYDQCYHWMIEKFPLLVPEAKICNSCRKQLAVESNPVNDWDDEIDSSYVCQQESLKSINQCLQAIGETPVCKKKLVQTSYPKEKLNKIKVAAAKAILPSTTPAEIDNDSEIIAQLKEKFYSSTDRSQKVQILTVLPKSWSTRKVEEEFAVSNYMARKAKDLVKDQGILSSPNPKHGSSSLSQATISLVQAFYELDEVILVGLCLVKKILYPLERIINMLMFKRDWC